MTSQAVINARPRLYIERELRSDMSSALLDVQIRLPLSGTGSAELRLVNWQGNNDDAAADFAFQALELGQTIEVAMGEPASTPTFIGEITALEECLGQGAPQLVILAEDALHRLAKQRANRAFEEAQLADVIRSLASDAGLSADVSVPNVNQTWHQLNESHLAFLLRVLGPYDLSVRIHEGQLRVKNEHEDPEPQALHAQREVEQLRIVADLNHQPKAVQVRGFDLATHSDVSARSDTMNPAPAGQSAGAALQELSWGADEIFPQPFARSQGEADAWAEARLRHRAKRFLYGEITCRGVATLRGGRDIELSGVSTRLRGRYQVVDCLHSFNSRQGFQTRIKIQRSSWTI